jgi:hypothetical protein
MTSLLTTPYNHETLENLFQVLLDYGRDVTLPGARGNTYRLRPKKSIGARVYNYVEVEHVVGASPFRPKKFHMTEMDMFIRFMYTKVKKAELNKVYLRTLENNERLAA